MGRRRVNGKGYLTGADLAVMLGSGLGSACRGFPVEGSLVFADIPGITAPEVSGHLGEFRNCNVYGKRCLFILGRKHHYEGADDEIHEIVKFTASLGVRKLVVTSASGSLDARLLPGELVLVDRLIDLQARKSSMEIEAAARKLRVKASVPVRERGGRRIPLRFNPSLVRRIWNSALVARVRIGRSTLASLSGPFYETPAEVRVLREIGAGIVSMSAAPEICFANVLGLDVAAICLVTNFAAGLSRKPMDHGDVLERGERAAGNLRELLIQLNKAT